MLLLRGFSLLLGSFGYHLKQDLCQFLAVCSYLLLALSGGLNPPGSVKLGVARAGSILSIPSVSIRCPSSLLKKIVLLTNYNLIKYFLTKGYYVAQISFQTTPFVDFSLGNISPFSYLEYPTETMGLYMFSKRSEKTTFVTLFANVFMREWTISFVSTSYYRSL